MASRKPQNSKIELLVISHEKKVTCNCCLSSYLYHVEPFVCILWNFKWMHMIGIDSDNYIIQFHRLHFKYLYMDKELHNGLLRKTILPSFSGCELSPEVPRYQLPVQLQVCCFHISKAGLHSSSSGLSLGISCIRWTVYLYKIYPCKVGYNMDYIPWERSVLEESQESAKGSARGISEALQKQKASMNKSKQARHGEIATLLWTAPTQTSSRYS